VPISPKNIKEDDIDYYSDNYYNIFTHKIQLTFKGLHSLYLLELPKEEEEDSKWDLLSSLMKNVNLKVNKIHIRYEDDYYSHLKPFAFGFLCDVLYFI